jgi:hypothetical protein
MRIAGSRQLEDRRYVKTRVHPLLAHLAIR